MSGGNPAEDLSEETSQVISIPGKLAASLDMIERCRYKSIP
jgi:hypothetical protein